MNEREVAGIRCSNVLKLLSDYLDRSLPAETLEQIEAHLRGCDWCERFGATFATTIAALRDAMKEAEPLDAEVARRIGERLRKE